jgi:diguanylate cyclase (GGDEF)-like protein/PAS domain S-box-containing protein
MPDRTDDCECRYQRIHQSMSDAFVLMDLRGRLVEWNPAFMDMLGYPIEELDRMTNMDLTPEKWRAAETQIIEQQVMTHGHSRLYEKEYIRKDGTILSVELKTHLLHDRSGNPEGLWTIVRDIGERKRMEAALREQEDFFRLIAENSGDFIAVLDLDGRRLYNSPSYNHFFGNTRYLAGTVSFTEIHPDDRERVRRVFAETVKTGVGQRIEYRFVLPDGAIRQMESRGGVIRDKEGRVARVVVVSNDITERKQAEEQIHQLVFYDSLTGLPNRRMLNDRLRQAMAATKRRGRYGALMFLDLDDFKPINDDYGHGVGDQLLSEAARRIAGCIRGVDTVARFGGDEFVVLLSDLDPTWTDSAADARMVAEKIRARLAEPYLLVVRRHEPEAEFEIERRCTASIGLVLFIDDEDTEEDLLRWSDIAMYQAKDEGGNRVRLVEPQDGAEGGDRKG